MDPFCSLSELTEPQQRLLFQELQSAAKTSYAAQGLTRKGGSFQTVDGEKGQFEFKLQCYGKKFCAKGKPVIKELDGPHGRTIWYTEDQLLVPRSSRNMNPSNDDDEQSDSDDDDCSDSDDQTTVTSGSSEAVERLMSGLNDESWRLALSSTLSSPQFAELATFVDQERKRGRPAIYPVESDVFSALNWCPIDQVKVVIVGQDPYHGPGQGHGLAFSVRPGVPPPPSLKNIFKEAVEDVGIDAPTHGYLKCWADQGVLMLNAVLTVRRGEANSHARHGWEEFTDAIIDKLNTERSDLVFMLWGNPAAKKARNVDETRHTIIRTSHPSPLGARRTKSPFLGSRCFSRANAALEKAGRAPIDWSVQY